MNYMQIAFLVNVQKKLSQKLAKVIYYLWPQIINPYVPSVWRFEGTICI